MRIRHELSPDLLRRPIRFLVVGAGGTGSAFVMGLPYLHQALQAWGHGYGLEVHLMDADVVTETNCVRQPFSVSDIGLNKATVLINRLNTFWGTRWTAIPSYFHERSFERSENRSADFLVGCVDTKSGRKAIESSFQRGLRSCRFWLDFGNNSASGQYILGQPLNGINRRKAERLRTVSELFPEILDVSSGESSLPSCSAVDALNLQEPFINQTLANSALAMLAQFFRYGSLSYHGAFFNARTGQTTSLPIDPEVWKRTIRRTKQPRAA